MTTHNAGIDAIAAKIAEDGTVTISGIDPVGLHSILTAASVFRHENEPQISPLDGKNDEAIHDNNVAQQTWAAQQLLLIEVIAGRLSQARNPAYSDGCQKVMRAVVSYGRTMKHLDQDVREAETKLAQAAQEEPKADPAGDAADALATALAEAQAALAKLNSLRTK